MRIPKVVTSVIGRRSLEELAKIGGGLWVYHIVSSQVDQKWLRWSIYGGLAMVGVYSPLAVAAVQQIWPTWTNLDVQPPSPPPITMPTT